MKGKKILVTGATGLIARPVAEQLAGGNEVWGLSIFNESERPAQRSLEAAGVHCLPWDMSRAPVPDELPKDITHVFHAAMLRETDSYDAAIEVNGVAVARLMERFRQAQSFLFVSSTAIYKHLEPDHRHKETDPLGGGLMFMPPYQVSKIAAEGVVRSLSVLFALPTTIIRPTVCYGPGSWGGVPVTFLKRMMAGEAIAAPPQGTCLSMPIHVDDIARMTPALFEAAATPPTIVNMAGDEVVSDEEYLGYISQLTGVPLRFTHGNKWHDMYLCDNSKRERIAGKCRIGWREGIRQTIQAHFPDLIRKKAAG